MKTVEAAMTLAHEEKAKKKQATQSGTARSRKTTKNPRRDKLPKWLIEEKRQQSVSASEREENKQTKQTLANSDAKERFEQMMEELKRQKAEKGGS